METIANRVRLRMKRLDLKEPPLAKACGVSQPTINRLLKGHTRNPPYIYELAKALETNVRWLKTGLGNPDKIEAADPIKTEDTALVSGEFFFKKAERRMNTIDEASRFVGQVYSAFRQLPEPVRREVANQLSRGMFEEVRLDEMDKSTVVGISEGNGKN